MLSDGLTSLQAEGKARDEVEVVDVAQMLLASVHRGGASSADGGRTEETAAEPADGDVTQTDDTVTDTRDVGPNAAAHHHEDTEESGSV
jgi:hypothetical protein